MPLSNLLVIIAVFGVTAALVIFPQFRKRLKVLMAGFLNIFIEDKAKTPEGAAAIYNQAIEEAREKYSKASDSLKRITGKVEALGKEINADVKKVQECEFKAREAMNRGDEDTARVYAEKRQELLIGLEHKRETLENLKPIAKQTKELFEQRDRELREIKKKKDRVLSQLTANKEMESAYDDLDELRKDSTTSRLLEVIDDECEASTERVSGARIVHESKIDTRYQRADSKSSSYEVDSFLNSLKNPSQITQGNKRIEVVLNTNKKKEYK